MYIKKNFNSQILKIIFVLIHFEMTLGNIADKEHHYCLLKNIPHQRTQQTKNYYYPGSHKFIYLDLKIQISFCTKRAQKCFLNVPYDN